MISRRLVLPGLLILMSVVSCSHKGTESKSGPPSEVIDLSAARQTNSSFILTWTIPGDTLGYPKEYYSDVRYALAPITAANWDSATQVPGVPQISSPASVTGLSPATVYYFAVKIRWKDSDWSVMSNVAAGKTLHRSEKVYGSSESEGASAVTRLSGGGCVVVGSSTRYRSTDWGSVPTGQTSVLTLDATCESTQQRDLIFGDGDGASAVIETSPGNIAVVGGLSYALCPLAAMYVFTMSATGGIIATKTISTGCDYGTGVAGHGVATSADGGLVVLGERLSNVYRDHSTWLLRLDANLDTIWGRIYIDTIWYDTLLMRSVSTVGKCIARASDGGYAIAGSVSQSDYTIVTMKPWLIKTDRDGNRLWRYVAAGNGFGEGRSIVATADGGFVVAGIISYANVGPPDVYILKVDGSGNLLWERTFGSALSDWASCIVASPDGGFVIAGSTWLPDSTSSSGQSDVYLLKIDGAGGKIWEKAYGGPLADYASGITTAPGGGYVVVGTTDSYGPVGMSYSNDYILQINENGELAD